MIDFSKLHYRFGKKKVECVPITHLPYTVECKSTEGIPINSLLTNGIDGCVNEAKEGDMAIGHAVKVAEDVVWMSVFHEPFEINSIHINTGVI